MTAKKNTTDYYMLAAIFILVALGIVMVYSASSVIAGEKFDNSNFFLKRHLLRVGIGLVAMGIASKINYRQFRRFARAGLLVAVFLLIYMLFTQSAAIKGSVRWISFGSFSFQPSEFAKFSLVLYMADTLARKQDKLNSFIDGYFPLLIIAGSVIMIVMLEPDFSSAVLILFVVFMMFFLGNVRIRHLAATGFVALPFFMLAVYRSPYRLQRLVGFLNPDTDPLGGNYQINQSLISLGSGGIFGVGIGQSKEKLLFLPEPFTDFIFSIIGEELGYVGTLFILVLFLVILWRGLRIARNSHDMFGSLLAAGITLSLTVAAFTNIGVVSGLLPTTGIPIPFISYGGTSLILSLGGCGILLNIAQYQTFPEESMPEKRRTTRKKRTQYIFNLNETL